jgi:hypothetical protein
VLRDGGLATVECSAMKPLGVVVPTNSTLPASSSLGGATDRQVSGCNPFAGSLGAYWYPPGAEIGGWVTRMPASYRARRTEAACIRYRRSGSLRRREQSRTEPRWAAADPTGSCQFPALSLRCDPVANPRRCLGHKIDSRIVGRRDRSIDRRTVLGKTRSPEPVSIASDVLRACQW